MRVEEFVMLDEIMNCNPKQVAEYIFMNDPDFFDKLRWEIDVLALDEVVKNLEDSRQARFEWGEPKC